MMGLPEILFGMALLVGIATPPLWPLVPVILIGYVLMRGAENVSNGVRDTSAPGSGCALVSGLFTILAAGVVVIGALLVLAATNGAI